jgi:tartrate-resistant acid phosphatase type 5
VRSTLACLVCLAGTGALNAQSFYNYVGQIESRSVLLAWGVIGPEANTIGRASEPYGKATVRIANRTIPAAGRNWLVVNGLTPDTAYPYEIDIDGARRGGGQVRTWPQRATHFCFFVIGDYGSGGSAQYRVADAMNREFERLAQSGCPVRFVLTVGDNIYADSRVAGLAIRSGDLDVHWESKFFRPYAPLLREIPFLPTLGNHDGNGTENRGDLFAYLDNFFFPGNEPARWYTFTYGGFAQFFALDSTTNSEFGPTVRAWTPEGPQTRWLADSLAGSKTTWKIPYFHNPIYTAGPRHDPSFNDLRHWVDLFRKAGVEVVFSGHEHNFQFSNAAETGGILYVVSGSGGELRLGDARPKMAERHMAGWAAGHEFLSVEIEGSEIRITPVSPESFVAVDPDKNPIRFPITQHAR